MSTHTPSQRYLSTRGGSYGLSFEDVVLKGLASDGGLFIPETIPTLPSNWRSEWKDLSFQKLAFEIFSLYISEHEIPRDALHEIIEKSYSSFRDTEITPTVPLDAKKNLYLLELFHGPTFAFKDVALQFLGNLFEYFLVRRNREKSGKDRDHLTVVGATSGDTGSAAIYGLRGKTDVSVFIMFPTGKVSPVQEAQMTTVTDANVHCLSVDGTFDDCQDFVKALFADEEINKTHQLAAVNSINWARILAQITYYFASYFAIQKVSPNAAVRFVVPTGNFGDILAGYFAKRMGLPIDKLIIATNENDILHRFWRSGAYEKKPVPDHNANGGFAEDGAKAHEDGAKETLSPAMDILVSSNFERLLWFLAYQELGHGTIATRRETAGKKVQLWLGQLKTSGGFKVEAEILDAARETFESERVSDKQTIDAIKSVYGWPDTPGSSSKGYILDPHSAIGVDASLRSISRSDRGTTHVALATAHPAKFSRAVELALGHERAFTFKDVLPKEFEGMEDLPRKVVHVRKADGLDGLRSLIVKEVEAESTSS